jgi:hypothetical protein
MMPSAGTAILSTKARMAWTLVSLRVDRVATATPDE